MTPYKNVEDLLRYLRDYSDGLSATQEAHDLSVAAIEACEEALAKFDLEDAAFIVGLCGRSPKLAAYIDARRRMPRT